MVQLLNLRAAFVLNSVALGEEDLSISGDDKNSVFQK